MWYKFVIMNYSTKYQFSHLVGLLSTSNKTSKTHRIITAVNFFKYSNCNSSNPPETPLDIILLELYTRL